MSANEKLRRHEASLLNNKTSVVGRIENISTLLKKEEQRKREQARSRAKHLLRKVRR